MLFNHEQVINYLPHRPPFLFIDTVAAVNIPSSLQEKVEITPRDLVGVEVIANFHIKKDLEILKGHFPGNPILPGVVQVEMMAQSSAFASAALNGLQLEGINVETLLLSIGSCKFRKPMLPGMNLEIRSRMVKCRGQVANYEGEIYFEGEKISEASFMAKLVIKKE